jgi:tRNA U38,U39,U40 pseudouridine synthase TruA
MKILKLLQELYLELKVFNENLEYFSCLENEKKRRRENPMRNMSDVERVRFKLWINTNLREKNITFEGDSYTSRQIRDFLEPNCMVMATKPSRDFLSAALGYGSFEELVSAWRQGKGGAA